MSKYDIKKFLENDIDELRSTERDVFKLILQDCVKGIEAVLVTNDNPVTENIKDEEKILQEIIWQL